MHARHLLVLSVLLIQLMYNAGRLDAQEQSPIQIGVTFGGGYVMEEGGMEYLGTGIIVGIPPNQRRLFDKRGEGRALNAGFLGSVDFDDRLRLEIAATFERTEATYEVKVPRAKVLLPNSSDPEDLRIVDEYGSSLLFTKFTRLLGELGASCRILTLGRVKLRLHAGVEAGLQLSGTEQRELRGDGPLEAVFPNPGTIIDSSSSTQAFAEQPIDNLSPLTLSLHGGFALDITLSDRLTLAPSVFYHYPLTDIVPDSDWRSRMVGGAIDVMWRL